MQNQRRALNEYSRRLATHPTFSPTPRSPTTISKAIGQYSSLNTPSITRRLPLGLGLGIEPGDSPPRSSPPRSSAPHSSASVQVHHTEYESCVGRLQDSLTEATKVCEQLRARNRVLEEELQQAHLLIAENQTQEIVSRLMAENREFRIRETRHVAELSLLRQEVLHGEMALRAEQAEQNSRQRALEVAFRDVDLLETEIGSTEACADREVRFLKKQWAELIRDIRSEATQPASAKTIKL
eukprot:TRINITY_DN1540_c0_g1_i2.p1 TRINITY_DN1540_c0_g1~~TRINITY_DN1540_c0_g1_i2.p1  ORF type:complete len:240 (+),score=25.79 TRINITY_DN1540_c0_g1_i2:213-932(+)